MADRGIAGIPAAHIETLADSDDLAYAKLVLASPRLLICQAEPWSRTATLSLPRPKPGGCSQAAERDSALTTGFTGPALVAQGIEHRFPKP